MQAEKSKVVETIIDALNGMSYSEATSCLNDVQGYITRHSVFSSEAALQKKSELDDKFRDVIQRTEQ